MENNYQKTGKKKGAVVHIYKNKGGRGRMYKLQVDILTTNNIRNLTKLDYPETSKYYNTFYQITLNTGIKKTYQL